MITLEVVVKIAELREETRCFASADPLLLSDAQLSERSGLDLCVSEPSSEIDQSSLSDTDTEFVSARSVSITSGSSVMRPEETPATSLTSNQQCDTSLPTAVALVTLTSRFDTKGGDV